MAPGGAKRGVAWRRFYEQRRGAVTLDDVPTGDRAALRARRVAARLFLGGVQGLVLDPEVSQAGDKVGVAVAVSLFDCASRRFFGGTFVGRAVEAGGVVEFGEALNFVTRVDDAACVAVLELVGCAIKGGAVVQQFGCGWAVLPLFGDNSTLRLDASADDALSALDLDSAQIYAGTPRRLVAAAAKLGISRKAGSKIDAASLAQAAGARAVKGCTVSFRLRSYDALLKVAHLLEDDEFVSSDELIPGLAPFSRDRSISLPPDGRQVDGRRPMLGVVIGKHGDSQIALANPSFKLAKEYVLKVKNIRLKVDKRHRVEAALLQYIGLQRFEADDLAKGATESTQMKTEKIIARRLCLGVHNGRALTMRRTSPDGWLRVDLARTDGDVLACEDDEIASLTAFARHGLYAIVALLEYEVRPLQRVAVLADGYLPVDSQLRFRLRTGADAAYVEVALKSDGLARLLSKNFVYPPVFAASSLDNASLAADSASTPRGVDEAKAVGKLGKVVGFELSAFEGLGEQQIKDETPKKSVESDSEVDENWFGEGADLSEAESSDEEPKTRERRPPRKKRSPSPTRSDTTEASSYVAPKSKINLKKYTDDSSEEDRFAKDVRC
ncbi:hypothetical protein M885DRAFT_494796 [Pelagophyceae sp. CCMP2097]|nr:hypothetical protein M885DRAFT_494796 [Pelagophyceae sp. CCMP2097]